jgi:hypothetical protein
MIVKLIKNKNLIFLIMDLKLTREMCIMIVNNKTKNQISNWY